MRYSERLGTNFVTAVLASVVMNVCAGLVAAAAQFEWFQAKLPQSGEGPSQEELEAGYYKMSCWALPEDFDKGTGPRIRVQSQFAVCLQCCRTGPALFIDRLTVDAPCTAGSSRYSQRFSTALWQCMQDMHRDGGYLSCSRMVLECALCMIPQNENALAQDPYASTCPSGAPCANSLSRSDT
jgi:hypothetical protein